MSLDFTMPFSTSDLKILGVSYEAIIEAMEHIKLEDIQVSNKRYSSIKDELRKTQLEVMERAKREYLRGVHMQQKIRYFPQIGKETDKDATIRVPCPNMFSTAAIPEFRGKEKREKSLEKSYMQAEVPFAGSWISPKESPILSGELNPNFTPAGLRIPKSLKLAFTEKIPKYIEAAQKS